MAALPLTRRSIFAQAWPIMVGQASVPLVGIVDATVIGRTGDAAALAGVALGATIVNLLFWSFGFLRMGTTGLVAQADGRGDDWEVRALLLRSLALGLGFGLLLLMLQWPLSKLAFALLSGGEAVTGEAGAYVAARFWGAPAALSVFAINGWLLGLGRTRTALALQILLNVVNIGLDLAFVWGLGLGAVGVGAGTAGAEWIAAMAGLVLCLRFSGLDLSAMLAPASRKAVFAWAAMKRLMAVNGDIMIRTIALLFLFTWFANAGARLGTAPLAANHVLLQFVSVAAFILDAFAFTAESRIGNAVGLGSRSQFLRAIRLTGEFSALGGALLALAFWAAGPGAIAFITTDPAVRDIAGAFLPFVIAIPLIGMSSWLLDGIFIGATRGRALRNAALLSTALYLALDLVLRGDHALGGNSGVWTAFLMSYVFRAAALGLYFPGLLRSLKDESALARRAGHD